MKIESSRREDGGRVYAVARGLELVDFDRREGGHRVRLGSEDLDQRRDLLRELIAMAFRNHVE